MDYGKWSGKKLATLSKLALWKTIQNRPSLVRFPDGESFLEMSDRAFAAVRGAAIGGKDILICSHGDVIKSIISSALGSNFDNFQRISVDPASISIIEISGDSSRVISVNGTSHLIKPAAKTKPGRSPRNYLLGGGSGEKAK
jgi:broad specificity phosphatase PhoE